jgi:hypothetical protein
VNVRQPSAYLTGKRRLQCANDVCSALEQPHVGRAMLAGCSPSPQHLKLDFASSPRSLPRGRWRDRFSRSSICSTGRRALLSLYVQRTQAVTYCRCRIHKQTRFCRIQEEGSKRRTERLGATRAGPDRKHRRFEVPMGALSPPGNPWGSSE